MLKPLSVAVTPAAWDELSKYNVSTFRDANHAFEQLRQALEQLETASVAEAQVIIDRFAITYSVEPDARILRIVAVAPAAVR